MILKEKLMISNSYMKVRTFGDFVKKWWFFYLLIIAKFLRGTETLTGNDILDIVALTLIVTGALYIGFKITGGEKIIYTDDKSDKK